MSSREGVIDPGDLHTGSDTDAILACCNEERNEPEGGALNLSVVLRSNPQ